MFLPGEWIEKQAEEPAYQWEIDNAGVTGITQEYIDYCKEWVKWCKGEREDKPSQ